MIAFLAVALTGQYYQQQAYNYTQSYARPYVEKTVFVAVENAPEYYAGLVATQQRTQSRESQSQQAQAATDARLDRLTQIIESLQQRIEASEPPLPAHPGAPPPAAEAVPPPPTVAQAALSRSSPGLAILEAKCAGCHTGAAARGGGLALFDRPGQLARLEPGDFQSIRDAVLSGRMPKGRIALTLREFSAIDNLINQRTGNLAQTSNPRKRQR